jgi:hypothetical protein
MGKVEIIGGNRQESAKTSGILDFLCKKVLTRGFCWCTIAKEEQQRQALPVFLFDKKPEKTRKDNNYV